MAQLQHHWFSWVGNSFPPGTEHYWWAGPVPFGTVVSATAHALALSGVDREITLKDLRTHVDAQGNRVVYFTIRNTGSNGMVAYQFSLSFVNP